MGHTPLKISLHFFRSVYYKSGSKNDRSKQRLNL